MICLKSPAALSVHWQHSQNGCQPTPQDGINLGSGGKEKSWQTKRVLRRTAEFAAALGFAS